MVGHAELDAGMPPSPVQDEHDLLARAGAHLAGKCLQFDFEERNRDTGGKVKERTA
jgi:hypothetical protein